MFFILILNKAYIACVVYFESFLLTVSAEKNMYILKLLIVFVTNINLSSKYSSRCAHQTKTPCSESLFSQI
jgi:hypothetical protein